MTAVNTELQRAQQNPRESSNNSSRARRESASQPPARQPRTSSQRQGHSQNTTGLRITYLQNPTVELIKHDKTVGQGVQKTLAYDTPFTSEQLENWRKEFWGKCTTPRVLAGSTAQVSGSKFSSRECL